MNKVYGRINWQNYPSTETAIDESNLNKMDAALNEIDTRVVEHDTTKANVSALNELIKSWHIDETTGVITIVKVSGEQIIFDLNIEKVPVGFSMTDDGILKMTTDDGTEFTANIGSMIPILTFQDTDEIAVSVSGEGVNKTYSFAIKTGSIVEDKLQPNFLADCRLYAGSAENSASLAANYAEQARESAESISNKASDIVFDDSIANTGAVDAQGAIEAVKKGVDTIQSALSTRISSNNISTSGTVVATKRNIIGSIDIPSGGLWLIGGQLRWGNVNITGLRSLLITTSSASDLQYNLWAYANSDTRSFSSATNILQITYTIAYVSSPAVFNFFAEQNSGADLNYTLASLKAYKIGMV